MSEDGQLSLNFEGGGNDRELAEFWEFHRRHPTLYRDLVAAARATARRGWKHYGIRSLWEVARWHWKITHTPADGEFKANDHHTSFYARLIMREEKDLDGFFEIRRSRHHPDSSFDARPAEPEDEKW